MRAILLTNPTPSLGRVVAFIFYPEDVTGSPQKHYKIPSKNEDHHLIWAIMLHDLLEMGTNEVPVVCTFGVKEYAKSENMWYVY